MDPIRQTLITTINNLCPRQVCKLCGECTYDMTGTNNFKMNYHMYTHFDAITIQSVNGSFVMVNGTGDTYSMISMSKVIPQLSYILPKIKDMFTNCILNVINAARKEIFSMGYTSYGSLSAIFCEHKLIDYRSQIIKMLDEIQFKCSLITGENEKCGKVYECGLPSIDLVVQHLESHLGS